jgi:hypothetical protein
LPDAAPAVRGPGDRVSPRSDSSRTRSGPRVSCAARETWSAGTPTAGSSSWGGRTLRSRFAASGSNSARSRPFSGHTRRSLTRPCWCVRPARRSTPHRLCGARRRFAGRRRRGPNARRCRVAGPHAALGHRGARPASPDHAGQA